MKALGHILRGLVGLLLLTALALVLWMAFGELAGEEPASPPVVLVDQSPLLTPTATGEVSFTSPLATPTLTPVPGMVEEQRIVAPSVLIPTATLWATPVPPEGPAPTPLPLRTPAPDPAGRIFFRTYAVTDDRGLPIQAVDPIQAVEVDERGEVVREVDLRWDQDDPRMYYSRMVPSPDGRYLAGLAPSDAGQYVFIIELSTGKFTLPGPGHVSVPGLMWGWHPNGNEILFHTIDTSEPGLWLVDVHTGLHRLVAQPRPPNGICGAAISPDGRWLAYGFVPGLVSTESPYEGVWLAESDGRNAQKVVQRGTCVSPWSPDNRYFLYIGGREGKPTRDATGTLAVGTALSLVEARTGETRLLPVSYAMGHGHYPTWAPDTRSIAYVGFDSVREEQATPVDKSTQAFRNFGIYTVDIGTGEIRRLASGIDPAWSPDGSMIVFSSLVDRQVDIWLVNADGSGQRQVTDTAEVDRRPVWIEE